MSKTGQIRRNFNGQNDDDNAGINAAKSGKCAAGKSVQWQKKQKKQIKRKYAEIKHAEHAGRKVAGGIGEGAGSISAAFSNIGRTAMQTVASHKGLLLVLAVFVAVMVFICTAFSSCGMMMDGIMSNSLGASFTAEDEDITGLEEDYGELEDALRIVIANTEQTHPGYDGYRYQVDEINHNPYELAAYLTVLYEDYRRDDDEVQDILQELFEKQYTLTYTVKTEGESRILVTTLVNNGLGNVILGLGMNEDDTSRYTVLLETQGCRSDLFEDNIYANIDNSGQHYQVPGEALSDEKFAAIIKEAEKYLGYPYEWGGSSPSTGFDCSGYVCYVLNHSGVYSFGRTTAQGLYNMSDRISGDEAKPGDLVFFTGTYKSSNPVTHVGIYVGNGMMINAGSPIKYANVYGSYWHKYLYAFGRLS